MTCVFACIACSNRKLKAVSKALAAVLTPPLIEACFRSRMKLYSAKPSHFLLCGSILSFVSYIALT